MEKRHKVNMGDQIYTNDGSISPISHRNLTSGSPFHDIFPLIPLHVNKQKSPLGEGKK